MKDYPNREALRKAHDIYRDAMRLFIVQCLKRVKGENIEDLIRDSLDDWGMEQFEQNLQGDDKSIEAAIDIGDFPNIIRKYWHRDRAFSQQFDSNSKVQYKTGIIADGRNLWAHPGVEDLDPERTRADLTYVAEVLGEIKNKDAKCEVEDIRNRLFSDEDEEHTADVSDQLEAARAENTELKKLLKSQSDRLEEVEGEWIASEERLTDKSNLLESTEAENADLKKRLSKVEQRLKGVESEKDESGRRIKTLSEQLIDNATKLEAKEEVLSTLSDQLRMVKAEKTGLEEHLKNLLKQPETLKAEYEERLRTALKQLKTANAVKIELEERLETASTRLENVEAELAVCKECLLPNDTTPDSVTFQGTTFTKHFNKYRVATDDITQTFWSYWQAQGHDGKQEMGDAGWSVKKVDGDWEVTISPENFEAWIEDNDEPLAQPERLSDGRIALPRGKEMEQPALEFLADGKEYRRVEIINHLSEHFSLTDDERSYLSRTGQSEKHLMKAGLIERTRTGYYRITVDGLEVLHRDEADEDSVFSNEVYTESQSYSESPAKSPKSQRKWRYPGAVAALRDPAEIREAEAKIARILNSSEKVRLERELREAKRAVYGSTT